MELLNRRDKFVQELPEKTDVGQFGNVDLLEIKGDQVQKGNEVLPQQRTKTEEFKDVKDTENMEVVIVQEGCHVPPSQSTHVGEFQDLKNRDKKEKPIILVRKEPSSKGADVDESKEEDIFEVKEKPSQMYFMGPSSAEICAVECKDGGNLAMKEKTAQENLEVRSPQNDKVGKCRDKEQSVKQKWPTKINDFDISQEIHIGDSSLKSDVCGGNLSTVQPSGSKSNGVLQGEDQNADVDCEAQKSTDLFAKNHGLEVKGADFTMDLEFASVPHQPVSMTRNLDAVKNSYFTDTPCQTLVDQQTTTKDEGNGVLNLDLDVKVCKSLAHSRDDIVPQICITQSRVQAPLLKLSSHVTQDQNTLRNLQFKLLRAKGSSLADQKAIQEKTPQAKKEELERTCTSPVNQFTGSYTPCQNTVQSHELESEGKLANARSQIDALICETTSPNILLPLSTGSEPSNCPEIRELQSTFQVTENAEARVLGREGDHQCPTPTMDEEPYIACSDLTSSNNRSCATHLMVDKNSGKIFPVSPVKSSSLIENSMPVRQQPNSDDIKDPDCLHHTNTDIELKTQGVDRSTDKNKSVSTDEDQQIFSGNVDKIDKRHEIPDQNDASLEVYPNSQRPVMAVKPSKGDKIQGSCVSQQSLGENYLKSNYSEGKPPMTASIPLNKNREEDMQGSSTDATPCSWLSSAGASMCARGTKFHQRLDLLHLHDKNENSKSTKILSSQFSESDEDKQQKRQTARENTELEKKSCSFASSASVGDSADVGMEYGFVLEPQNSLACTIFNTNNNRPESLLEKLSKRCIQDDPTQASMEQECLIFSEQMKQLIKRAKSGPIHQLEAHDQKNIFCPNPVTVRFSDLEEVETEVGHFDEPSFVLPKIKVDIGDGKTLADTTGRETTPCPQEECNEPVAHTSVSEVTEECARLYTSTMNDVCGVSKVPFRSGYLRVDKVMSRTQPSNHFDFCDQMKKEVDYNFCNSMNSVVKKFCKTKYKFFILATSNDVFFEKTKVR